MHQIQLRLGLRPRPRWGSLHLQRSPDHLDLSGSTSKGREGKERDGREGMYMEGEKEGGGEGRKECNGRG